MRTFLLICLLIALVSASHIRRFSQESIRTNQYLVFDDDDTAILFDTGFGDEVETQELIDFISSQGVSSLNTIFVTHGHPDHYGGVPMLHSAYPTARIEVSSTEVKTELLQSVENSIPDSTFNWNDSIKIYDDDELFDELDLLLLQDFPAAESEYYAMVHNADDNWIITGDVLSIDFHPYLGESVNIDRLRNWYSNTLVQISLDQTLGLDKNTIYYPGHGKVGDYIQVDVLIEYLMHFEDLLFSCPNVDFPRTLSAVKANLIQDYPEFEGEDILDFMVANQAWIDAQVEDDPCYIIQQYFTTSSDAGALFVSTFMIAVLALL